jgi:hypothetical protein
MTHHPSIVYRPGSRACRQRWRLSQPNYGAYYEDIWNCPSWSITGEDGLTITVVRESHETNGHVSDAEGKTLRYGWDLVESPTPDDRWDWGPIGIPEGFDDDFPVARRYPPATLTELTVMNKILRPVALKLEWDELVAQAEPCPHFPLKEGPIYRCGRFAALWDEDAA